MTLSSDFSVDTLTLAHEDLAANRRLHDEFMTAYPCRCPIERGFLQQAFAALIEKRRSERLRATQRTDIVRTAELFYERVQEDYLYKTMNFFNQNCEYALRHVTRTAMGCRWAIGVWQELERKLSEHGTWYGIARVEAIQLMGFSAGNPDLYYSELALPDRARPAFQLAAANPKQANIDSLLDPANVPPGLQDRDVTLWPGNPVESRARLQALVDRELPRLRALEESLRVQYEDPARAEAQDMALVDLTRQELPLLRAERMYEQSYACAVAAYMKVRKQGLASRMPTGAVTRDRVDTRHKLQPAFVVGRSKHRASGGCGGICRGGLRGRLAPNPNPPPTRGRGESSGRGEGVIRQGAAGSHSAGGRGVIRQGGGSH